MNRLLLFWAGLVWCGATGLWAQAQAATPAWDRPAAARYLDARLSWWSSWPVAARDHQTFCISCHTALPYALARPQLRTALGEPEASPGEQKLRANVVARVRLGQEAGPFYPDKDAQDTKTAESRGTEAVLNALILTSGDATRGVLQPETRQALDHMWAQQQTEGPAPGGWRWLQFHNAPWEGSSEYFGATLAALAVGYTPASYRSAPEREQRIGWLVQYLRRDLPNRPLLDRLMLLWAAAKLPSLLTTAERERIVQDVVRQQQPDGGFCLSSFVGSWQRRDHTPLETKSDGYATGLAAFVLEQVGGAPARKTVDASLAWLTQHQEHSDGRWIAYSLNKQRDLSSDAGRFMSDAATAYAVLALSYAR